MSQGIFMVGSLLCLLILFRIMSAPIRLVWKLLVNMVSGFMVLVLLQVLGSYIGVVPGINLLNIILVALLGLPGVGTLLMLHYFVL